MAVFDSLKIPKIGFTEKLRGKSLNTPHFGIFIFFPVTQNLREINFGETRRSKTAVFAFFEGLHLVKSVNFRLQKLHNL